MNTTPENIPKNLHVIGICGVAMSAIAIAFHKRGVNVTGSDKGFFPPVSTELEKQGIKFYAGWHPENMSHLNSEDSVVMVGTASGSQNPETSLAKEKGLPMYSYPEILGKYFCKENSVVCSGTWGKTSSSALISFVFEQSGLNPSYMFGGVSLSHESSAKLTDSKWSVFEGDEYKSSPTDPRAKFFHYKPTHLLLSAVSWDHADLYPTENDYFEAFKKLISIIPADGLIVACKDNQGVEKIADSFTNHKVIYYGRKMPLASLALSGIEDYYSYTNTKQSRDGISFTIEHNNQSWTVHSPMLGLYQIENMTGCFAMAHKSGIKAEKITEAISKFKGLRRRLEKRHEGDITVIDDIAHSPDKSRSVLSTLKSIYSGKVICVFEPNIGGRERGAVLKYDNAFNDADLVIIPRLTKLKVAENETDQPMEGDELAQVISKTHSNTVYIEDDEKLVSRLVSEAKKDDVIAFLGSHGFRGMIEETVGKLTMINNQ
ncbi:MAG: Mur ligase domain-containing protein [Candidatus Paceibacterota bacterium]|jgi:UDP-N-acetylmuramate: L-alanyl-gamma-D-glutamyl-meso-diaminopimelate ligase